ncbi:trans-Golgi network integral membrane protein 2-like isoform X2 [Nymphalis io]|uniref:trans-Golgi network integral membrane protein 2-like isoform X2 n=1 Tax=Inachis io TaxID=171585 RepID=UPI00216A33C8|nr:trans-Golgi network integral membrane protein 2-like isoform X2 [Nymphalis io]
MLLIKMFRGIIVLILINVYYPSLGLPVKENSIGKQLQNLAITCDNSVLSDFIKKQIDHCNVSESADAKTEFKCLMFYDINSQLCTAFRRSKFNLQENYTTKMNEIQDIKTICNHAKTWKFIYKEKYPKNEPVDQVFKNEVFCIQMCSVDGFLSADSNFYCKYYQWGSDVLQSQMLTLTQQNIGAAVPVLAESISNPIENNTVILNTPRIENGTTSTSESVKPIESKSVANVEWTKTEINNQDVSGQSSTSNQSSTSDTQKQLDNSHKITEQSVLPNITSVSKNEMEKPPVEEEPPKKDELEKDENIQPIKQKESVIENPKVKQPIGDIDEDQEDENDDDAEYVQGSDQDDAAMKPIESDPNFDDTRPKNTLSALIRAGGKSVKVPFLDSDPNMDEEPHKTRVGIESITSETFPNPMQNGYAEEDDHFFPLFLTAIIIVVLLYILYHNKNKFTKVILGLIVEGRQSGRRRNSRGHAYRRLDTLEQAMNTNTAAPPSKIIY